MKKLCSRCGKKKDGSNASWCRKCTSSYYKKWREENRERYIEKKRKCDREYQKKKREKNPDMKTKEFRKYREKNPEKTRAHAILNRALSAGKIKRSPCEVCGEKKVHGHHDDYSKPLEVRWLCPVHHAEVHQKQKDA